MDVTATTFPHIWDLCLRVLYDNGAVNREEPVPTVITLPFDHVASLLESDVEVMKLTEEEKDTFAFGEHTEALEIAVRNRALALLSTVLNLWFDRGMPRRR